MYNTRIYYLLMSYDDYHHEIAILAISVKTKFFGSYCDDA